MGPKDPKQRSLSISFPTNFPNMVHHESQRKLFMPHLFSSWEKTPVKRVSGLPCCSQCGTWSLPWGQPWGRSPALCVAQLPTPQLQGVFEIKAIKNLVYWLNFTGGQIWLHIFPIDEMNKDYLILIFSLTLKEPSFQG